MQVSEIWRYPVKSMGGERLTEAVLTELGVEGDRSWGVRDTDTGNVLTGRREPKLLMAAASLASGALVIETPDGGVLAGSAELSAWLERPVELAAAGAEGGTYENPLDFEHDADWMSWQGPGGAWHDSPRSRVSLVSTASLGRWDVRRFRSNLVVDGEGEDALAGSTARLGGAVVRFTLPITRCVMVTRAQPGLDRDLSVLRTVNAERAGTLSIGALVVEPGAVRVGDVVEVIAPPDAS